MYFNNDSSLSFNLNNHIIPREKVREIVAFEIGNHNQLLYQCFMRNGENLNPLMLQNIVDLITFACLGDADEVSYQKLVFTVEIILKTTNKIVNKIV